MIALIKMFDANFEPFQQRLLQSSCLVTGANGVYWMSERHSENALKVERAN